MYDSSQCGGTDGDLPNDVSCVWVIQDDSISGLCINKVSSCGLIKNRTHCETSGAVSGGMKCFWLYSKEEGKGESGTCESKNDNSLTCGSAVREEQCETTDLEVTMLGSEKCVWLVRNSTNPSIQCVEQVRFNINNIIIIICDELLLLLLFLLLLLLLLLSVMSRVVYCYYCFILFILTLIGDIWLFNGV
jgi:hypothetical protein